MGAAAQRRAARGDRGPLAQAYAAKSDGLATDNQAAGMGAAETGAAGIGHYSSTAKEMKSHVPGTWVRSAPELLATIPGRLCLVECRLPVLLQQPISPGPQDVVHCLLEDITPALSESACGLHDLTCVGHELLGPPRRSTRPRRMRQTCARLWVAPCTPVRAAPPAPQAGCEHRVSRTCLDCFAAAPNQGASMLRTDRV